MPDIAKKDKPPEPPKGQKEETLEAFRDSLHDFGSEVLAIRAIGRLTACAVDHNPTVVNECMAGILWSLNVHSSRLETNIEEHIVFLDGHLRGIRRARLAKQAKTTEKWDPTPAVEPRAGEEAA